MMWNVSECSNFAKPGARLSYGLVKRSRRASDVAECERLCIRETQFVCRTFSFNSGVRSDYSSNNCEMTDRDYRDMNYGDFDQNNRDWDIIERTR